MGGHTGSASHWVEDSSMGTHTGSASHWVEDRAPTLGLCHTGRGLLYGDTHWISITLGRG